MKYDNRKKGRTIEKIQGEKHPSFPKQVKEEIEKEKRKTKTSVKMNFL